MSHTCPGCHRTFKEARYYHNHIDADSNKRCYFAAIRQQTDRQEEPTASFEAILGSAESEESNKDDTASEESADTVFDFHGSDSETQSAKPAEWRRKKAKPPKRTPPRGPILGGFKEYVNHAEANFASMPAEMKAAVELKKMLNDMGAPNNQYDKIFQWHVQNLDAKEAVTSDRLHNFLVERYNMKDCLPYEHDVHLPHSDTIVKVTCHDFMSQLKDLLTDPRLSQEDYLFHDGDPAAPPPKEWDFLEDVNTGEAYRATYDKLIRPKPFSECGRARVLLPIIMYLDGCVTGQFNNLGIEILKFTIGILNRDTRNKNHAWRKLGFVKRIVKGQERAKQRLKESHHVDAKNFVQHADYRRIVGARLEQDTPEFDSGFFSPNYTVRENTLPTEPAQDLHSMLQVILHSYHTVEQKDGFPWDLIDWEKHVLKQYWFVPFIMFVKVDGQEGDKLSGQYVSKKDVAVLCRYCTCPTQQSEVAYRDDPPKTMTRVLKLVKQKRTTTLKEMSQQYIWNAFYPLRFGLHNDRSIHGAVAPDPMHLVDIGKYGYLRDNLFAQLGKGTMISKLIDEIATTIGILLKRQSDKDLPRTTFSKGVKGGKVMAHEMTGILLVLLGAFRCTLGRVALLNKCRKEQKINFPDERAIRKWIILIEANLQWGEWLKWPSVKVETMERFKVKSRELMNMDRVISKRQVGMKQNTMNHHAVKHMAEHYLWFGVPENVNCRSDENHHIPDKKTAKGTDKRADTWDPSIAKKDVQKTSVDYGIEELNGRPKWEYYKGFDHSDRAHGHTDKFDPQLGGPTVVATRDNGNGRVTFSANTTMIARELYVYEESVQRTVAQILDNNSDCIQSVTLCATLKLWDESAKNNTQVFRAMPFMEGKPWHDWALFDLSTERRPNHNKCVPCHLKAIVDLRDLPSQASNTPGTYVIAEPAYMSTLNHELGRSELWSAWVKDPANPEHGLPESANKTLLIHTKKLLAPTAVIPDIGNNNTRAYLRLLPRSQWGHLFNEWIEADHTREWDPPE